MSSSIQSVTQLFCLLAIFLGLASAAIVKDGCSTADVSYVKSALTNPAYFCTFYTARGRVLSPFVGLDETRAWNACKCIKQSLPATSRPSLLPAPQGTGFGPKRNCFTSDIAVLRNEFKSPKPFCDFYSAWSATSSTKKTSSTTKATIKTTSEKLAITSTLRTTSTFKFSTTPSLGKPATWQASTATTYSTTKMSDLTTHSSTKSATPTLATTTSKSTSTTTMTKLTTISVMADQTITTTTVQAVCTATSIASAISVTAYNAGAGQSIYATWSSIWQGSGTTVSGVSTGSTTTYSTDMPLESAAKSCASFVAKYQDYYYDGNFNLYYTASHWVCVLYYDVNNTGADNYGTANKGVLCSFGFGEVDHGYLDP
ncbi:hypothetical protein K461DRAFT_309976 [Myriangium duriaei CBS 260.36]|uniref:Uncharacterized protein n=1 Tax=Myriangium duriaei CBS 260.36 TaxID=1168546 RepID=A0A9P4J9X1_9PEZI|nr:hypothetical protein K461DRAFT_309976 [Myriangium duriaei CBS 260.36]